MKVYDKKCVGFVIAVFLFSFGKNVYAEELLTLPESISLAIKNNPAIQIAEANKKKAEWNIKEAKAYNGVKLGYNFLYGRTDQSPSWYNNTTAPYPLPNFQYPAWSETYSFYGHQFKLELPLYTGHKLESMAELANHNEIAMDLGLTASKQQIALEATNSYYTALESHNLTGVAQQAVDDFNAHLTNVRNYFDAGTASLSDVLQTQVRLANARNNLIKAKNAETMARYKLNKVIGIGLTDVTQLDDSTAIESYAGTLDTSLACAFKNRPEIQQAKLKESMSQDKLKIAQSESLPSVGAAAIENISDTVPSTSKHNTDWTVGVNVSFNVFDNGVAKAHQEQALADFTVATQQKRQLEDTITLEVSNAFLSVEEANERIKNNQVAVNQSSRDYKMAQERYEAGVGTNLDVMDAEVAMTQAKTNYVQALYDYSISRAQLYKAMGIIL